MSFLGGPKGQSTLQLLCVNTEKLVCYFAGKELEAAGVLVGAQQKFEDKALWNLQVPFVAPDGTLVPYAWKRQIAGQAAASAYDRARYFYIQFIFFFTFQ